MAVGRIVAYVMANTANFTAGMKGGRKELKTFGSQAAKTSVALGKFTVAATAAGAATFAALVRQGMQAVDAQAKLARSVEGTIGGLEGLQRAAKDAGVDVSALNSSAQRLQVSLGEARRGTGRAAEALEDLGLKAADLAAMDVDERMASIADAMKDARMTGDQMADALARLGIRNREMVLLMQQGGDSIRDATEEMRSFGLAVDGADAAMIESLNDQFDRAKDLLRGVTTQLAVHMAPAIRMVVNTFADASKETRGFSDYIERGVIAGVKGAVHTVNAWRTVRIVFLRLQLEFQKLVNTVLEGTLSISEQAQDVGRSASRGLLRDFAQSLPIIGDWAGKAVAVAGRGTEIATSQATEGLQELVRVSREVIADIERDWIAASGDIISIDEVLAEMERLREEARAEWEAMAKERADAHNQGEKDVTDNLEVQGKNREKLSLIHQLEMERLHADHLERMAEEERRAAEERKRIQQLAVSTVGNIIGDGLRSISAMMDKESRAAFEITKAAGIANATIATFEAINRNLAAFPGPLGAAMATAAGIAGFANVASIAAQTFGGGGSRSGATPSASTQTIRREITIRGEGTNAREFVRSIIPELNEALGDGAIIRPDE